ncbi:MAG: hypothetical protein ACYDD0_03760, partial [Candidatus Dormibacteria bacterium]
VPRRAGAALRAEVLRAVVLRRAGAALRAEVLRRAVTRTAVAPLVTAASSLRSISPSRRSSDFS